MEQLLPDRLKALWQLVDRGVMTAEAFRAEQAQRLDDCRAVWAEALRLEGHHDLQESLLTELGGLRGLPRSRPGRASLSRRGGRAETWVGRGGEPG